VTLVLLIRHALTDATGKRLSGRTRGIHLSDAGRDQAEALVGRLEPLSISAVYASPLERCVETARPFASARGLDVRVEQRLIEVAYGTWTGRSMGQLTRTTLWKQVQSSPSSVRFPEGESLGEVQQRAVSALNELAAAHPRGVVAAVTHADVIRLAVAHYCGVHLDLFQRFIVGTTSVSAVLLGDRIPRILRINDTGSLEDLAVRAGTKRSPRAAGSRAGRAVRG
jgi:probable phosphoglycerate mutase